MRATRDLVRRRPHGRRNRAELLAHGQHTNSQDTLPELGKKIASTTTRDDVAARCAAAAVPKPIDVALALLTYDDALLTDRELAIGHTAKPHAAPPCSRLRSLPGVGPRFALGLLEEMHALHRFPRVQDFVSSCR